MLHSEQRPKKRYKFRNFEFWASYGKIAFIDTENYDPKYNDIDNARYISPGEFLKRAMAIRAILDETNPQEGKKLLEDALACVKEAKEQGDISDYNLLMKKAQDLKPIIVYTPPGNDIIQQLRKVKKIASDRNIGVNTIFTEGYQKLLEDKQ